MSFDISPLKAYQLGKNSPEKLMEALRIFEETGDIIPLTPYLASPRRNDIDCDKLGEVLRGMMDWMVAKWLYRPVGPAPWERIQIFVEVLCRAGTPAIEELFKEALGERAEPPLLAGEGEE